MRGRKIVSTVFILLVAVFIFFFILGGHFLLKWDINPKLMFAGLVFLIVGIAGLGMSMIFPDVPLNGSKK